MDRSHKHAIGRVVAIAAALLVASGFVGTSLLAGGPGKVTASQLLTRARPGTTYVLAGTVLDGSVRRTGSTLYFRVADPRRRVSVRVRYSGEIPDPFAAGRPIVLDVRELGAGDFVGEAGSLTTNLKQASVSE
jgi:cytochrome c-type biogenesis protein CcmE